jgi:hypothetical protein
MILRCARAGRWLLLACIPVMLAVAAIDAAAVAGAVVLAAAFLLTRPMVRDLERQARPRPDYARIRELERDLYGREFFHRELGLETDR